MIWLSRPTKRLLLEMSVGVILWNVILAVLAVLFLPGFSYPVVPVISGAYSGSGRCHDDAGSYGCHNRAGPWTVRVKTTPASLLWLRTFSGR